MCIHEWNNMKCSERYKAAKQQEPVCISTKHSPHPEFFQKKNETFSISDQVIPAIHLLTRSSVKRSSQIEVFK